MAQLQTGEKLNTVRNHKIEIVRKLGEGGQGCVYEIYYDGDRRALKWYHSNGLGNDKNKFYDNIKSNVFRGSPMAGSREDVFLWPIDITEWRDGTFGYVMGLKPDDYYEMSDFLLTHVKFDSYRVLTDAMLRIVNGFRILHYAGYSYQDINDGNFFINPSTGQILIGDTDNVAPDKTNTGILGKARYMAPEIVVGRNLPDIHSDQYSMALILFMMLLMTHPLEGKKVLSEYAAVTPAFEKKIYGSEPVFILDPEDKSNGPDNVVHKNLNSVWPCLPDYLKELFTEAFSQTALQNPNRRVTEAKWLEILTQFRNSIIICPYCGNEVFTSNGNAQQCERCGKVVKSDYIICIGEDTSFPCSRGGQIFRSQLGLCDIEDALTPVGKIQTNKAGDMAIRNVGTNTWTVRVGNQIKPIEPNEFVRLNCNIEISMNGKTVKIVKSR